MKATKRAGEIIVVDDGLSDGTRESLKKLDGKNKVRVILHEGNHGKGAAVVTGINAAKGDVLLIQDADLEYNPRDYPALLQPIEEGVADVVYGSRFLTRRDDGFARLWVRRQGALENLGATGSGLSPTDEVLAGCK